MAKDFIAESVEFMGEFLPDVFGCEEWAVTGDAFGFGTAEEFQSVGWRVLLEDVGTVEFGVIGPDLVD